MPADARAENQASADDHNDAGGNRMTTTVVIGSSDDEQTFVYEGGEGDAEDRYDAFEADVPTELVERMNAGWKQATDAIAEIAAAAGYDQEDCRLVACCPEWRGYAHEGHQWWEIVLEQSGTEHEWPIQDAKLGHKRSAAEAEATLAALPDELHIPYGVGFVTVAKTRLRVEEHGFGGSISECYRCGWARRDHADEGTPA